MTECFESHIYGRSSKISRIDGIKEKFDLFIFSIGWESRCIEVTRYDSENLEIDSSIIVSFMLGNEKGYPEKYMKEVESFCNKKRTEVSRIYHIERERKESKKTVEDIIKILQNIAKDLGRPLNIGFDITSCPRYLFLSLLAICIKLKITEKISFFYAEGEYKGNFGEYLLTRGNWNITEVFGYDNAFNPELKNLYIVSAGFEGNQYRSLVSKYEPDYLGVLIPDPGFVPEYTSKVYKECTPMIKEFNISENAILKAPAGDAIAAWRVLKTYPLNAEDFNIIYLTHGPKPHILAMGIHGLLNKNIFVTYRIPDGYTRLEVEPTNIFWRYDIKNLIFL